MFSVLFPGQGSQSVGMAKDLYNNFDYIKVLFEEADDTLNLSKIILSQNFLSPSYHPMKYCYNNHLNTNLIIDGRPDIVDPASYAPS